MKYFYFRRKIQLDHPVLYLRVLWYSSSSDRDESAAPRADAILLCSLTKMVCRDESPGFSVALTSPPAYSPSNLGRNLPSYVFSIPSDRVLKGGKKAVFQFTLCLCPIRVESHASC